MMALREPFTSDTPVPAWSPRGGGATGALVRALDWSATGLGPLDSWSPALRTAVDIVLNSPVAMVLMWGPSHSMVYNDAYALVAGNRHPHALGATVPAVWPESWDWNREILAACLRGETRNSPGICLTVERDDAPAEGWFDLCYTPVHEADAGIGGVLCTVLEVRAPAQQERPQRDGAQGGQRHIEQALRNSEERLGAIFGQASVGLAELSLDGRFRRVNDALARMLGRSQEELMALQLDDLIHPDDMAENHALVLRLMANGTPFTLEKRYCKPDGSWAWISSSMSRLDDEQGWPQALIAVKTDITSQRTIEAALRDLNDTLEQRVAREVAQRDRAEEALRQSQKMEAVGQLTGGVAHDFNNVLQIISGNLQLLYQQVRANDVARRRVEIAVAAVERGARLSSQLLAFARRQPLQPVVTDLGRLVINMDELLRRALGEAVELSCVVSHDLWNTLIDPGQVENVVLNLAINARDAMSGAGRLIIELGNTVLDEYYVHSLPDVPAGEYVMLAVTDSGCGMNAEVLQRAFEPFFTTKAEGEGTGLGLSMAYGFVKQSRGHIKIYSEPGKGTSVQVYLPRSTLDVEQSQPTVPGPVTGGTETVLVVEDDSAVRQVVVDMLGGLGYKVLQAEQGEQALAVLQSGVAVDMLFTDVVMPGNLRSPELARLARQMRPGIAVLFTSGYPQDAIVPGGRLDDGVELLSKPYRRDELARKLRHVLANRPLPVVTPVAPAGPTPLHILVVEDNIDSLHMVCELVGMLGHNAHGVADGEQAWELMQQQEFDLLFTDVSLPGMSGIELARKVRIHKPMRIVFSTGYDRQALSHLEFPASYLRKPYDLMELQTALEDCV